LQLAILLQGSTIVQEGQSANYKVVLDGSTLAVDQTISFELRVTDETAIADVDYGRLFGDQLVAEEGLGLVFVTVVDATGDLIKVRLTNNTTAPIGSGSTLLRFSIPALADRVAEPVESFKITLQSDVVVVTNDVIQTRIQNAGGIILSGTNPAQWAALSGDTTVYGGIAAFSAAREITVSTGDGNSRVRLSDAIAYATLHLGDGDNDVSILVEPRSDDISSFVQFGHGAYFATIRSGSGNDVINIQSAENRAFVRPNPQDIPSYELSDYYQSIVDVGAGDDYVYAFLPFQSHFFGGDGVDTIFFYGRFSDWSYQVVDVQEDGSLDITLSDDAEDYSVWTVGENVSSTARNNRVQGFEFVQFNDILLKIREAVAISGPASVSEGSSAVYAISLAGDGLRAQESVTFDLRVASLGATVGLDYTELTASLVRAASTAVKLDVIESDPVAQTLRVVVTTNRNLATGVVITNLSIPTLDDAVVEGPEQFSVTLSGFIDPVTVVTTIAENDAAAITLSGPGSVSEGATTPYTVSLSGVGLGAGQSLRFTLSTRDGSAKQGQDYQSIRQSDLIAGAGIRLDNVVRSPTGSITVDVTNTSGLDLPAGAQVASFSLQAISDFVVEGTEDFVVELTSGAASVVNSRVSTRIKDINQTSFQLSGPSRIVEGRLSDSYHLSLGATGLGDGQILRLQLELLSRTADIRSDLGLLLRSDFTLENHIQLIDYNNQRNQRITFGVLNSAGRDLLPGTGLASFLLSPTVDQIVECSEDFLLRVRPIASSASSVEVATRIIDVDRASLSLSGPATAREGSATRPFRVNLRSSALASGQVVDMTINLSSAGGAVVGRNFKSLTSADLRLTRGLSLVQSRELLNGGLSVRLQNNGQKPIPIGAVLLRFRIETLPDDVVRQAQRLQVVLRSRSAAVSASEGEVTTRIIDTTTVEPPPGDGGAGGGGSGDGGVLPSRREINGTNGPDVLIGNELNNIIYGAKGADVLTGNAGANTFRFRLRDGLDQGDVITDFRPRSDTLRIDDVPPNSLAAKAFGGQSRLSSSTSKSAFKTVDTLAGADRSGAVFLYSRLTGELAYKDNGSDSGFGRDGGVVATLPVLLPFDARDIQLVYGS
jgi:Ca2+-binding RTX toxin-like protein